ncbi:MAG: bifunctional [glutamate--ammonia ligase]-adenylyl-L-tyrosine phosphorylase/[glutamate--ammonia-ligase] adenylyltransferase [Polyangiaceae bacterium]|nr:bifunctional [glutamate--ammonia ligase]-adenylyl-L-tyrosine phosphorylase/[glutamate--ammonia-ligase] adenylyltransferase [Polyangiaceae bacterium]
MLLWIDELLGKPAATSGHEDERLAELLLALAPGHRLGIESLKPLLSVLAQEGLDPPIVTYREWAAAAASRDELRQRARIEKLRIGLFELGPEARVERTSFAIAELASSLISSAALEAIRWAEERFGVAEKEDGTPCRWTIFGMGKLGGGELNLGSDVDLIAAYETDLGCVRRAASREVTEIELFEYFSRVYQRVVTSLEIATEYGTVWPVDLRLRPEGGRGPIVHSLAALERYYESWGRTWERAALLRAAPVAADIAFGNEVLEILVPFVWRKRVEPLLANELSVMLQRARSLDHDAEKNVKIGTGGIRDVEFFVQALQLVWGGKDASLRTQNTWEAIRKLFARGYISEVELEVLETGLSFLRTLEHRIHFLTQKRTHLLPSGDDLLCIARSMRFKDSKQLLSQLTEVRASVHRVARSVLFAAEPEDELEPVIAAIETQDESAIRAALPDASTELVDALLALTKRPSDPLGTETLEHVPEFVRNLVEQILRSVSPEVVAQMASLLFAKVRTPATYYKAFRDAPQALTRLISLFSVGPLFANLLLAQPSLMDELLFGQGAPTASSIQDLVRSECLVLDEDPEEYVARMRRSKTRATMQIALADFGGDLSQVETTELLSLLAEEQIRAGLRHARMRFPSAARMCVVAMGKLGGNELGYGSDLDMFFVYENLDEQTDVGVYVKSAQWLIRLLTMPSGDGAGYELDTRLRPSGNAGLLVTSMEAFHSYHSNQAADWERQALLRARVVAGDVDLEKRLTSELDHVVFSKGALDLAEFFRIRMRMLEELSVERQGVYDPKLGVGALVDVEFFIQLKQLEYGAAYKAVHTMHALDELKRRKRVTAADAKILREAYQYFRALELRFRAQFGNGRPFAISASMTGALTFARRLGHRRPGHEIEDLLQSLRETRRKVRGLYAKHFQGMADAFLARAEPNDG